MYYYNILISRFSTRPEKVHQRTLTPRNFFWRTGPCHYIMFRSLETTYWFGFDSRSSADVSRLLRIPLGFKLRFHWKSRGVDRTLHAVSNVRAIHHVHPKVSLQCLLFESLRIALIWCEDSDKPSSYWSERASLGRLSPKRC
jgi:hypothetical protein